MSGYFERARRKAAVQPRKTGVGARLRDEAVLTRVVHAEVGQEYGWPRMAKELVDGANTGRFVTELMRRFRRVCYQGFFLKSSAPPVCVMRRFPGAMRS